MFYLFKYSWEKSATLCTVYIEPYYIVSKMFPSMSISFNSNETHCQGQPAAISIQLYFYERINNSTN